MKKIVAIIAVLAMFFIGSSINVKAQENSTTVTEQVTSTDKPLVTQPVDQVEVKAIAAEDGQSMHSALKQKYIEGGPSFMTSILLCLIFGLALAIERVIYLNLATTNSKKLLTKVEGALFTGGYEAAKEVCRNTRGPVASIFYQGLDRHEEGVDVIEKSIISYGGVQTGLLEKGLSWVGLFIALGPMLGFLGTVIGMIQAFDAIEVAGDISPTLVAAGIKVALITTVFGLIVAMILQVFYNYCLSKIDSITNDMENSSISLLDMIVKFNSKK
jgi:biopolymer transport protein ExbB